MVFANAILSRKCTQSIFSKMIRVKPVLTEKQMTEQM